MGFFSSLGNDPQKKAKNELAKMNLEYSEDAFFACVCKGQTNVVQLFLEAGINLNTKGQKGFTAALFAAANGQTETLKILLDRGADIDLQAEDGRTALLIAVAKGHQETAKYLIDAGADVNIRNLAEESVLDYAINRELVEVIEKLIDKLGVDNKEIYYTLLNEAGNGKIQTLKIMIKKGAGKYINLQEPSHGYTILIAPAARGHTDTVNYLIEQGADVNIKSLNGDTALTVAVSEGHTETVKALINKGADVNIKFDTGPGLQPLLIAETKGFTEIIQILKDAGASG